MGIERVKRIMKFLERKIYNNLEDVSRYQKEKKVLQPEVTKIMEQLKKENK